MIFSGKRILLGEVFGHLARDKVALRCRDNRVFVAVFLHHVLVVVFDQAEDGLVRRVGLAHRARGCSEVGDVRSWPSANSAPAPSSFSSMMSWTSSSSLRFVLAESFDVGEDCRRSPPRLARSCKGPTSAFALPIAFAIFAPVDTRRRLPSLLMTCIPPPLFVKIVCYYYSTFAKKTVAFCNNFKKVQYIVYFAQILIYIYEFIPCCSNDFCRKKHLPLRFFGFRLTA